MFLWSSPQYLFKMIHACCILECYSLHHYCWSSPWRWCIQSPPMALNLFIRQHRFSVRDSAFQCSLASYDSAYLGRKMQTAVKVRGSKCYTASLGFWYYARGEEMTVNLNLRWLLPIVGLRGRFFSYWFWRATGMPSRSLIFTTFLS